MHNQHSPHIDQATIDRWQADGAVLLKGVFTPWVERLAEGVTALMASPSEYGHARTVIPKDGSPPFFQDYCNWSRIPAFSEFVFQSAAAEIAAALMQSQTAKFFHEHTLVKPAGGSTVTPWHHDQPYYCVSGRQNVSFWIPLDPVAEATSLRCIRGSHRWRRSSVLPVSMALSFTSTPGSAPCRISTPMRTNTISSAGRWSRGMRWPSIFAPSMAPAATPARGRDGSSPPAGWG